MKKATKTPKQTAKTVGKPRVAKKLGVTKSKTMKKQGKVGRPAIGSRAPTTKEQKAGIPSVVSGNTFEGARNISHLDLPEQMDIVFNPLHSITRTTVSDAVSDSTYIVTPAPKAVETSNANLVGWRAMGNSAVKTNEADLSPAPAFGHPDL